MAPAHGIEPPAKPATPPEKTAEKPAHEDNPPPEGPAKIDEPPGAEIPAPRAELAVPGGTAKPLDQAGPPAPAKSKKLPPPDEAALKGPQQKLHDRYRWEMTNENTNEDKMRFVDRLVRDADTTRDDTTTRLVMLQEAVTLAREAGDTAKAIEILDTIGQSYDINVVAEKVDMVQARADELNKALGAPGTAKGPRLLKLQQGVRELLEACQVLILAALDRGDVETALRCLNIARPAATRLNDHKTKLAIDSSIKDMEKLRKRLDEVHAAVALLRDKPDDAEANSTVGTWYCLVTGDWDTGLPYLAKGADADLADPAKKDLARPSKAADQVAAGNLWWNLGKKKTGLEAARLKNLRRPLVCPGLAEIVRGGRNGNPQTARQQRWHRPVCVGIRRPRQLRPLPWPQLRRHDPHYDRSRGQVEP